MRGDIVESGEPEGLSLVRGTPAIDGAVARHRVTLAGEKLWFRASGPLIVRSGLCVHAARKPVSVPRAAPRVGGSAHSLSRRQLRSRVLRNGVGVFGGEGAHVDEVALGQSSRAGELGAEVVGEPGDDPGAPPFLALPPLCGVIHGV